MYTCELYRSVPHGLSCWENIFKKNSQSSYSMLGNKSSSTTPWNKLITKWPEECNDQKQHSPQTECIRDQSNKTKQHYYNKIINRRNHDNQNTDCRSSHWLRKRQLIINTSNMHKWWWKKTPQQKVEPEKNWSGRHED